MAFHEREYQVYVGLGQPSAPAPWVEPGWARIFAAIDPVISAARGAAAVSGFPFGRIGFSKAINDFTFADMLKPGPRRQVPVSVENLAEGWTTF